MVNNTTMNIFELTRILNEMKADELVNGSAARKAITNYTTLIGREMEKKGANKKQIINKAQSFLSNIQKSVEHEIRKSGTGKNENKIVSMFTNKVNQFLTKSKTAKNYTTDQILADSHISKLSEEEMIQIMGIEQDVNGTWREVERPLVSCNVPADILKGFDKQKYSLLCSFEPGQCGPYEFIIGMIFNGSKVTGHEGHGEKGDVYINGKVYELKTNGSGGIDKGWEKFERMFNSSTDAAEKAKLRNIITALKNSFKKEQQEMYTKVMEYVEAVIKSSPDLQTNKVNAANYFALLDEEGKKKAILFGFKELGYKNLIVANSDGRIRVVEEEDINNVLNSNSPISSLGIDISIPANLTDPNKPIKTAAFVEVKISIK
jgi:hypothetical protein